VVLIDRGIERPPTTTTIERFVADDGDCCNSLLLFMHKL